MSNNISKECTITVNDNVASLDKDVYLFKNDRNIDVFFNIVNSDFKYSKSDDNNVVMSSQASFAQIKFKKDSIEIPFPVQATEDGKVKLTISKELTDEDTELGDYSIQIRLFDYTKSSYVTLPAVMNCIHIQAPLFDDVSPNTIDTATVDLAQVEDGEVVVLNDENTLYEPTVWNTGDVLSKQKVNKIEQGIKFAHKKALNNTIPKVTPPTGTTSNDYLTLYNALPDSGLVFITNSCHIGVSEIVGLCDVSTYTAGENGQCKLLTCYNTGAYSIITHTGNILDSGIHNGELNYLMSILSDASKKKGQVLTMESNTAYSWQDLPYVKPTLYTHAMADSITLTLDTYQLLADTPEDTLEILLPEPDDTTKVHELHFALLGNSTVAIVLPGASYQSMPSSLEDNKIYEFIFTYMNGINGNWLGGYIEYDCLAPA